EGGGDAFGGDVVMRRPDPAGGEDVTVPCPQGVERGDDLLPLIGDDPRLAQRYAELREPPGQEGKVGVARAAGEDLVADDQQGRGRLGPGGRGTARSRIWVDRHGRDLLGRWGPCMGAGAVPLLVARPAHQMV